MADEPTRAIDDLLLENRTFPPPEGFKEASLVAGTFLYDEAATDYQGFWARQAAALVDWSEEWHTICEWDLPYAKWFIGGQLNVAENCLDRHVAAGRGDKVAFYWEGEPGDSRVITYAELLAEVQRFANVLKAPGGRAGRPGQHLPADDPRGRRRDAGLRPHRRAAQRRVRRLLVGGPRRPHQRRRGQGPHHRRRRLPPGRGLPAQAPGRRGRGSTPSIEHVIVVRRGGNAVDMEDGPRPLVPRAHGRRRRRVPGRADGRRAAALPPLHLGHDRQAQGHHAHHRRLPHAGGLHPQVRVRPPRGHRRVLVHGRHRLGHRPQLHRLRAAGQRRDQRDVRGRPELPRQRPPAGRSSRSTRSRSSTPRPPPSGRS